MSRFFKAQVPVLGTDFMAQIPWDQAALTLDSKQKGYDTMLEQAALLDSSLQINHLATDFDKEAVQQAQDYYGKEIENLSRQLMENPNANVKQKLKALSTELNKDLTKGTLSKVKGRYDSYQKWAKDNEKRKEENPDLYSRAYAKGLKALQNGYEKSGHEALWNEDNIMEDIDWSKEVQEVIKGLEPEMTANGYANTDGRWVYKGKESNKFLSQTRIMQAVENKIKSNPKFASYVRQRGSYGVSGYLGEDGSMVPMFTKDTQGNIVINSSSAFAAPLKMAGAFGYSQRESEKDMKADEYSVIAEKHANDKEMAAINFANQKALKLMDNEVTNETMAELFDQTYNLTKEQSQAFMWDTYQNNKSLINEYKIPVQDKNGKPLNASVVLSDLSAHMGKLINTNKLLPMDRQVLVAKKAELDNKLNNWRKGENTASITNLKDALISGGVPPARIAKVLKDKQAFVTNLLADPNLIMGIKGVAKVTYYDNSGNVKKLGNLSMQGLNFSNLKGLDKTANSAVDKLLEAQEAGTLASYAQKMPIFEVPISDYNSPNFNKLNGTTQRYQVQTDQGRLQVDYFTSLENASVDTHSATTLRPEISKMTGTTSAGFNGLNPQ